MFIITLLNVECVSATNILIGPPDLIERDDILLI